MFRLLDRYLVREIVPYFLLSILLLTAIIFAQEASRFSELIVVASRSGLPMQTVSRVMTALLPGILVFTLPVSLLIGTLVGLGRLSGDSEIVALGASGMSRWRILRPVVAISLATAAIMVYVTFYVLPHSVRLLSDLKQNQALVFQGLNTEIKPRVFEESIPQKVLYIEDIDRASNVWHNIFLVDLDKDQSEIRILTATSGSLRQGERTEMPELLLRGCTLHQLAAARAESPESSDPSPQTDQPAPAVRAEGPPEMRERKRSRIQQQSYTAQRSEEITLGIEVPDDRRGDQVDVVNDVREVEEMSWPELIRYSPPQSDEREWRAEVHKRLALPAACLVFALLGVGFGISNVRTGRSFGLLLGLGITIIYYLIALWGQHAALLGKTPVWFGMWLANSVLLVMGITTIIQQRRPGSDPLSALSSIRHAWPWKYLQRGNDSAATVEDTLSAEDRRARHLPARRFHLPQLLDRLVLTDLMRSFVYILAGLSTLFLIITLFQMLDSITRNNIEWTVVATYLLFLLPFIINNVTPPAALVAVMITFGVLEKTSQLVAIKASGQSIYRMAAPALAGSLCLGAVVFFNQDYVMPFTNPRQNNLRYLIRKGQEPPQTFYQTNNQWIFGLDSRIFNYSHFELKTNTFARLNVLDLTKQPYGIARRVYARRATWDPSTRRWTLENGWERRFSGDNTVAFEPFKERQFEFEETPEYFKKDSRGAASLTLAELQRKISDLSHSGFDVVDLRIELQGKIAFPLTCMVMVLVALPFSFSVGKRGALYGVAIGIALGLAYWGVQGLFGQMGRYEMLPPILAAWGPNLLFGAGGLYLFLHSRT